MEEEINDLFFHIRDRIYRLIQDKNVDIDMLSFRLGVSRNTFVSNFSKRIEDFTFYLETLSLLEHWEA